MAENKELQEKVASVTKLNSASKEGITVLQNLVKKYKAKLIQERKVSQNLRQVSQNLRSMVEEFNFVPG